MTGHFTSYETRTNHELATWSRNRVDRTERRNCDAANTRAVHTAALEAVVQ